ncbi:MAG TPA: hypothetical protein VIL97_00295 [Thermoanaerobaculia bacterium]
MANSFPSDVVVCDTDNLLQARFDRNARTPKVVHAKNYRLPPDAFAAGVVTPAVRDESAIGDAIRRMKIESGRLDRISLLLPDSWFRINILDLATLPESKAEAAEVVRWGLKRSLPVPPEELRIAYHAISRNGTAKVLVVAALEKTLDAIESLFAKAEISVVMIEPVGMNIWNAVTVREQTTTADRLFFYLRERDFTTALFRAASPLFIRSRNLSGDRSFSQEIRLSASYLRDNLQPAAIQNCYVAGNNVETAVIEVIAEEFKAPVTRVSLKEFAEWPPSVDAGQIEAELTACTGVFTA